MHKKIPLTLAACAMMLSIANPTLSSELNFNPDDNCTLVLKQQKQTAGAWAFGYLVGRTDRPLSFDGDQLDAMIFDLSQACLQFPDASFIESVEEFFGFAPIPGVEPGVTPESANPQSLLDKFSDDSQPLKDVLLSLRPTPEDVRALFPEPMATNLLEMYAELFGERLQNEGFPDTYVLSSSTFTTTMGLATHPVLDEIAGGFKDVLGQFQVDVPWGTIHIEFPEVEDDIRLSGMTFINGRWVLMMRPWRGIED